MYKFETIDFMLIMCFMFTANYEYASISLYLITAFAVLNVGGWKYRVNLAEFDFFFFCRITCNVVFNQEFYY